MKDTITLSVPAVADMKTYEASTDFALESGSYLCEIVTKTDAGIPSDGVSAQVTVEEIEKPIFYKTSVPWGTEISFLKSFQHTYQLQDTKGGVVHCSGCKGSADAESEEVRLTATEGADNVIVEIQRKGYVGKMVQSDPISFTKHSGITIEPSFRQPTSVFWSDPIMFIVEPNHDYWIEGAPPGVSLDKTSGTITAKQEAQNVVLIAKRTETPKYKAGSEVKSKNIVFWTTKVHMSTGGQNHTVVIKKDGTLWSWGDNSSGQLGRGGETNQPGQVGSAKWIAVAAGYNYTLAIREDDTLWSWGDNDIGQLGRIVNTSTPEKSSTPGQVGSAQWHAIAAGSKHTVAIQKDGTLWSWGDNGVGQLGLGDTTNRTLPQQVGSARWQAVAAGRKHTVAIREDNTLWTWGNNTRGKLGRSGNKNSPGQVGSATWKTVDAGEYHTVGIQEDGTLWSWGYNRDGQLGVGFSDSTKISPAKVGSAKWKFVASGEGYTLAIQEDGTLWTWGYGFQGQLGRRGSSQRPGKVGHAKWKTVAAGMMHTVAIREDNTLWSWGYNGRGQLGHTEDRKTPNPVLPF